MIVREIDGLVDASCCTDADLRSCARCELSDADWERVEGHLKTCDLCQRKFVEYCGQEADSDWLSRCAKAEPQRIFENDRVGKYRLNRQIGAGGMGVVYEAIDNESGTRVAIKSINLATAGQGASRRAIQEFQALRRLSHAGIVPVVDVILHEDRPYLVLDYVDGLPLNLWQNLRPVESTLAARIVSALADAVDYAHRRHVIHRDLKPSNVMVSGFKPGDTLDPNAAIDVRVTDFGVAKVLDIDSGITQTGEIIGTPAYMAPEQTFGDHEEIGIAADIYALGVILYELLTGRPPLVAVDPVRTMELVRNAEPISPRRIRPDLPRDLETICLKCLEKRPVDRYSSADALKADLVAFIERRPIKARKPGAVRQTLRWADRNRGLAVGLSVAAISLNALLVGSLWFAKSQHELRAIADEQRKRAQEAETVSARHEKRALENEERTRQFWAHSLEEMQRFHDVLGRELQLGIRSPDEIRSSASTLMISLYTDYIKQLGPVDKWTLADVDAVARHAYTIRETAGSPLDGKKLGDAFEALDRIEASSENKLRSLHLRASLLGRQVRLCKDQGDFKAANESVGQALEVAKRIITLTPDDPIAYRNASAFAMNRSEILLALGDQSGFVEMGATAVRFQRDGALRLPNDPQSLLWLAERLGHYAHMLIRLGRFDDAKPSITEAREVVNRMVIPEPMRENAGRLLQSFDQMEHDIRQAN